MEQLLGRQPKLNKFHFPFILFLVTFEFAFEYIFVLDLVFPCFSVNFQVFGDPTLAMEVEKMKRGGLYHLGGLKNKNLNKKISFSILPHLSSLYSSYFQASPHLELRPSPSKHLCLS